MIKENLETVRKNIAEACERSARKSDEVTLIAVSKTKPVELIMEAYEAGVRDFGENKAQELAAKYEQLPKDIRWHMIGHLQRNKVKYIIDKTVLIHSVDSLALAQEISRQAVKHSLTANILVEVNIADEESKFGVPASEAAKLVDEIISLQNISVRGLMCIAPNVTDSKQNRKFFKKLCKLVVDINKVLVHNTPMTVLSMGMTGDYQVAVEEGATMVRVGTGIFGERDYNI
ncbi:MAG: YggS family pyridoxal phosphate-dependent enzyme [Lachnospiraceae bacterium]|nr:YggS family pyridoxal phosphate-dependent enzyme [Lachnospiraceae bacterium]